LQKNSRRPIRGQLLDAENFLSFSAMLLFSGVFWAREAIFGKSAQLSFLIAHVITAMVFMVMVYYLPRQMLRVLRRLAEAIAIHSFPAEAACYSYRRGLSPLAII